MAWPRGRTKAMQNICMVTMENMVSIMSCPFCLTRLHVNTRYLFRSTQIHMPASICLKILWTETKSTSTPSLIRHRFCIESSLCIFHCFLHTWLHLHTYCAMTRCIFWLKWYIVHIYAYFKVLAILDTLQLLPSANHGWHLRIYSTFLTGHKKYRAACLLLALQGQPGQAASKSNCEDKVYYGHCFATWQRQRLFPAKNLQCSVLEGGVPFLLCFTTRSSKETTWLWLCLCSWEI